MKIDRQSLSIRQETCVMITRLVMEAQCQKKNTKLQKQDVHLGMLYFKTFMFVLTLAGLATKVNCFCGAHDADKGLP